MTRRGRNGSRTVFSAATPIPQAPKGPKWLGHAAAYLLSMDAPKSRGFTDVAAAEREALLRTVLAKLRGETASSRSNNPREAASRCIHGVLHCKDGAPCLPVWSDSELARLCHNVSRRTRSWVLASNSSPAIEVSRSIGASMTETSLPAAAVSRPRFRGRNSVGENTCVSAPGAENANRAGNGVAICARAVEI